jgi:hypothetical protein
MHEYARSRYQAHLMSYDRYVAWASLWSLIWATARCMRWLGQVAVAQPVPQHPVAHSRALDNSAPLVSA